MTDKNAYILHPGGGIEHVIIAPGKLIKPWLMAEFIRWLRSGPDKVGNGNDIP